MQAASAPPWGLIRLATISEQGHRGDRPGWVTVPCFSEVLKRNRYDV